MSERDELANVIEAAYDLNEGMATFELLAHAVLAAGYRKPRTISTVEELEALFQGDANVVLLDEDGVSLQNLVGGWRASTGSQRLMTSDLTFHCFGPTFTVLHEEMTA